MFIDKLSSGKDVPNVVNVLIEVSMNCMPVKYEFDKEVGTIVVDRIVHTPMHYPGNYGFIPHTMSDDGDPVDVMVLTKFPLQSGCVVECKPIGVLIMEDESGQDEKIIAVPTERIHISYKDINDLSDLPEITREEIAYFFTHYKDLEKNKWAKVKGFENAAFAKDLIKKAVVNK
jgi:inorganic pyrophosphatase